MESGKSAREVLELKVPQTEGPSGGGTCEGGGSGGKEWALNAMPDSDL